MKLSFAEKTELRKVKYLYLAAKNSSESNSRFNSPANRILSGMGGEPIKIGHHSEGRHRRLIARAWSDIGKGIKACKKAQYYADKAEAAANNRTIYSDDENAIQKLEEKLAKLEASQAMMKDINSQYRKYKGDIEKMECSDNIKESIKKAYESNRYSSFKPFAAWMMSNNNATIKATKERLEKLKKAANDVTSEVTVNDITILDNVEDNRVQILFPGKPSEDVRKKLKSHGFHWSPSNSAWQRLRGSDTLYYAKKIVSGL